MLMMASDKNVLYFNILQFIWWLVSKIENANDLKKI